MPAAAAAASPPRRFITNKMCPFAQKAWIALEESGLPYRLEEIPLYGSGGKPDWFWTLNPAGTVPVLVVYPGGEDTTTLDDTKEEEVLADSDLILDAMEQGGIGGSSSPSSLLVDASRRNAKGVQEWRSTINQKLIPVGKRAVLGRAKQQESLVQLLKDLDSKMGAGPFLLGDAVTTADCHAFPFLWRIHQEFGLDDYPALNNWLNQCQQRDSFRKTIQSAWWWWW